MQSSIESDSHLNFFPTTINAWENIGRVSSGGERLDQTGWCQLNLKSGFDIEKLAANRSKTWFASSHMKPRKIQRKNLTALHLQQQCILLDAALIISSNPWQFIEAQPCQGFFSPSSLPSFSDERLASERE